MYSILLKVTTCSSDRWKYLQNDDGSIYQEEDLEKVRLKVIQLLSDNVLSAIKVVANKRAISHIVIEGNPDEPGQWLPEVTVDDNGKVLMVINGEWDKGTIEVGDVLPDVTIDDNGKVLKVVNGEWAVATGESTDEKVKQSPVADLQQYRVILSNTDTDTEETADVNKSNKLKFSPRDGRLTIGRNTLENGEHSVVGKIQLEYTEEGNESNVYHIMLISPFDGITADSPSFDIELVENATWDGTNSSLKTTIASLQSETVSVNGSLNNLAQEVEENKIVNTKTFDSGVMIQDHKILHNLDYAIIGGQQQVQDDGCNFLQEGEQAIGVRAADIDKLNCALNIITRYAASSQNGLIWRYVKQNSYDNEYLLTYIYNNILYIKSCKIYLRNNNTYMGESYLWSTPIKEYQIDLNLESRVSALESALTAITSSQINDICQ